MTDSPILSPVVPPIVSQNEQLQLKDGIYCQQTEGGNTYFNADEDHALAALSALDDLCAMSGQLEDSLSTPNLMALLGHHNAQYLHAFDFQDIGAVLECSEDFGTISRFCAQRAERVDVVKTNSNAIKASRYHCADLTNVCYMQAQLLSISLPKGSYDLIIANDLELQTLDADDFKKVIAKLYAALSDKGVLLIKCQNPNSVKKQFDQGDAIPFQQLYASAKGHFALSEWLKALELVDSVGNEQTQVYSLLPNCQNAKTLLNHDYLNDNPYAVNHYYGAGIIQNSQVNEYLYFSHQAEMTPIAKLAEGYLLTVAKDNSVLAQKFDYDFVHFSSAGRKRQWRTLTSVKKGDSRVTKRALFDAESSDFLQGDKLQSGKSQDGKTHGSQFKVSQDLSEQPFQAGHSLAGLWLKNILQDDSQEQLFQNFAGYYVWLKQVFAKNSDACYDLLPFNIIVDENEKFQVIDPEWQVDGDYDADFIYFRAIFWFVFQNRSVLANLAKANGLFSIGDFVSYVLERSAIDLDLSKAAAMETQIQCQIEKQFNQNAIEETLRLPLSSQLTGMAQSVDREINTQLFFYDKADAYDVTNSCVSELVSGTTIHSINIAELDTSGQFLRIDPVDSQGFYHLSEISLLDSSGDALWSLQGDAAINETAVKSDSIVFAKDGDQAVSMAITDDPFLVFDLSKIAQRASATSLQLKVDYYQTDDFRLAMNELGNELVVQKAFIQKQRNQLEEARAQFAQENQAMLKETLDDHHEAMQKTQLQIAKLRRHIEGQQQDIANLTEMLERKLSRRMKDFVSRKLGVQVDEPSQEQIQAAAQAAIKPHQLGQDNDDYQLWIAQNELQADDLQRIREEIDGFAIKPTFSIVVPVYNIEEEYLDMAVDSVINQLYPHWQLCLVDDASPKHHIRPVLRRLAAKDSRISIQLNKVNGGIGAASNDGLGIAKGDYVGLLDHDDELTIDALYENAKLINSNPDIDFIYSDEDKMDMQGRRIDPFFKPDYSPDLLDSQNYVCHFSVFSERVLKRIGGFRKGFDGSQDHDIIIRAISESEHVAHIPKVLYHWRKVPGSTADVYDSKSYAWEAGRRAVAARLEVAGEQAEVELGPLQGTFRVKRAIIGEPLVSIIIPFKDKPELLRKCIDSILTNNAYPHYEIVGVSNNSTEPVTKALMREFSEAHENIRFVEKDVPFNFSLLCNYGVAQSNGEYVLLLNNDIEITTPDWLLCLLGHAQREKVGAVGGKLFYPDGRIQHAGVVAGMHGAAGHKLLYFSNTSIGYYGSLMVTSNVAAVTGAMLMVSRQKYDEVSGLDEENLAVAYNDVDLCLKLLDAGYINVFDAFCCATHHESASRGYEDNPQKLARLEKEKSHFVTKWATLLEQGDPYFNPNFDISKHDLTLKIDREA